MSTQSTAPNTPAGGSGTPPASPGRLGQRRGPTSGPPGGAPPDGGRNPAEIIGNYRQRLDQLKMEIIQLSNRNMDNTLRHLRGWLKEAKK